MACSPCFSVSLLFDVRNSRRSFLFLFIHPHFISNQKIVWCALRWSEDCFNNTLQYRYENYVHFDRCVQFSLLLDSKIYLYLSIGVYTENVLIELRSLTLYGNRNETKPHKGERCLYSFEVAVIVIVRCSSSFNFVLFCLAMFVYTFQVNQFVWWYECTLTFRKVIESDRAFVLAPCSPGFSARWKTQKKESLLFPRVQVCLVLYFHHIIIIIFIAVSDRQRKRFRPLFHSYRPFSLSRPKIQNIFQ